MTLGQFLQFRPSLRLWLILATVVTGLTRLICQAFPAYKLHELRDLPTMEIMQAMELAEIGKKVRS